jgi:hypothetical protein
MLRHLHSSFFPVAPGPQSFDSESGIAPVTVSSEKIETSLTLLSILLANSDPSPLLHSIVLGPILPALFSLLFYLQHTKAEPVTREEANGLLLTWARVCEPDVVLRGLVRSFGKIEDGLELGDGAATWSRDDKGAVCVRWAESEVQEESEESVLQLRLDPEMAVEWLKELGKDEIVGPLFLHWLGELRAFREENTFEHAKR